jgi:RNA polymerase sigma factor (sigma-70 family)
MLSTGAMTERNERVSEALARNRVRLRNFIRSRVDNESDVEDLLQDVFSALVEAESLTEPVRQVGAWLFQVARNRIIDRFRQRGAEPVQLASGADGEGEDRVLHDWLPSPDAGPEAVYARGVLLEELDSALDDLPPEQREVFVAHELEGRSFKQLAEQTGVSVNTLLSRKHYAVLHLRERLQAIYDELVTG